MIRIYPLNRVIRGALVIGSIVAIGACNLNGDGAPSDNLTQVVTGTSSLSNLSTVIDYVDENGSQANDEDLARLLISEGPYTVFAPTNAAFVDALDLDADGDFDGDDVGALADALGGDQAAADALYKVVANHVSSGNVGSGDLSAGLSVDTLAGDAYPWGLSVNASVDGVRATFTDAGLTDTIDVNATNGVAHVIDSVLLDDTTATALDGAGVETGSTLTEIVSSNGDLEGLFAVIKYIDKNGSQADADDLATLLAGDGPFTAFLPSDAAFDNSGLDSDDDGFVQDDGTGDPDDFAALENSLGSAQAAADVMYDAVANHVTNADELLSNELSDGQSIGTLAGDSAGFGLTIDLTDGVTVIPTDTESQGDVVTADVQALNGVAHIIDSVLEADSPE